MTSFDDLVAEAMAAPFSGWDFSWLAARTVTSALPWDYSAEVTSRAAGASALLDLGTGGGEWLAALSHRPASTVATEGWPPNVGVAAARLRPLGVPVVQVAGAPDNPAQDGVAPGGGESAGVAVAEGPDDPARSELERAVLGSGGDGLANGAQGDGRLPFRDASFPLVINRHEAFLAAEVRRILAPGGTFVTQQVDYRSGDGLRQLLGLPGTAEPDSWLPLAVRQVTAVGLTVTVARAGEQTERFADVAAVVYYLRAVSWAVPGLTFAQCVERLRPVHETPEAWPVTVRHRRFLLIATG